jgi:hypothetical protein
VEERLDRALANNLWFNLFMNATIETLVAPASNHYPILLKCSPTPLPQHHTRHFRYESAWQLEPDFKELVTNSWKVYSSHTLIPKLSSCVEDMSVWRKTHCHQLKIDIEDCRRQLHNTWLVSSSEEFECLS